MKKQVIDYLIEMHMRGLTQKQADRFMDGISDIYNRKFVYGDD